jgi:4-hydroxy-tetrahydrodipicolinate synthase
MDEVSPRQIDGVIPILVTPFDAEDRIDQVGVTTQVEYLLANGVQWVGLGFGSEVDRMCQQEVTDLITVIRQALGPRGSLVGNVEANADVAATRGAIDAAAQAGVDAVMLRPCMLPDAGDERYFDHLSAIAHDAAAEVIVQDAPQHTGVHLEPRTLARLALDVPGVAGLKIEPQDSADKIGQVHAELKGKRGSLIGGHGGRDLVHEVMRGATGTMPGPAFPVAIGQILTDAARGQLEPALRTWARLLPVSCVGQRSFTTFLWVMKHILARQGVIGSTDVRGHGPIDPQLAADIDRLLDVFGGDTQ